MLPWTRYFNLLQVGVPALLDEARALQPLAVDSLAESCAPTTGILLQERHI